MIFNTDDREELRSAIEEMRRKCPNALSKLESVLLSQYNSKQDALLYQVKTMEQVKYMQGIGQVIVELLHIIES